MIHTNLGKFRKHADDSILRECRMSGLSTPESERAAHLVAVARSVLNLTEEVHDGDTAWVWRYLTQLNAAQLSQLAFVALAAVPTGQTLEQAFDWVLELPDALAVSA